VSPKPRVVGLGGGHGLAASLRAIRRYAGEVCAVVSVADDGGSSGRLRAAFGIPAPGDLRRCLVALAADGDDGVLSRAFEHRFDAGELSGHALGNLVIAGLAAATGSFEQGLAEAGRLLGCVGQVRPATTMPAVLEARVGERQVSGQVAVDRAGPVSGVWLVPPDVRPPERALSAIAAADQVVLGPGSLFTSVLAVLAVPGLREALASTGAQVVYVANLRAGAETAGLDVAAHEAALVEHGVRPDVVLADATAMEVGRVSARLVTADLARPDGLGHDPARLGEALAALASAE
jgi:uncharacterized cofD-like protein